jgi:membrane protein YdbS with pleckstrin-like domain
MSNASGPVGNVSPAQDQEVVFYEGSPKLRGESGLIVQCLVAAVIIGMIAFLVGYFSNDGTVAIIAYVVGGLIAFAAIFLPLILVRKNRYRISNYRIDYEQGLLSKRIDTIELWHVDDVQMRQTLFDRMLGVGTINIHSSDPTNPVLPLRSLPEPRKLYDAIKQRVIAVKRQRGVIKFDGARGMDMGGPDLGNHHH